MEPKCDLSHFKKVYGFLGRDTSLIPFGSRVYGTNSVDSDYDFIGVHANPIAVEFDWDDTEYKHNDVNIHAYGRFSFQCMLRDQKIHALEAYFHPDRQIRDHFEFRPNLHSLRHEISSISSNSFVKAKKKIEVDRSYHVGWKSLFHSLRILNFGIQIATKRQIEDYAAANHYWQEIADAQEKDWNVLKDRYKKEYNRLASDFRKVAPTLG